MKIFKVKTNVINTINGHKGHGERNVEIYTLRKQHVPVAEIAQHYNLHKTTIRTIVKSTEQHFIKASKNLKKLEG